MKREYLINKRKEKYLSQAEVARRLGITRSHYCNIEAGKRGITLELANNISIVLGIKFDYKNFV